MCGGGGGSHATPGRTPVIPHTRYITFRNSHSTLPRIIIYMSASSYKYTYIYLYIYIQFCSSRSFTLFISPLYIYVYRLNSLYSEIYVYIHLLYYNIFFLSGSRAIPPSFPFPLAGFFFFSRNYYAVFFLFVFVFSSLSSSPPLYLGLPCVRHGPPPEKKKRKKSTTRHRFVIFVFIYVVHPVRFIKKKKITLLRETRKPSDLV